MSIKIAITGSIASGKTTLTQYLKNEGYSIFDADFSAHSILQDDKDVQKLISEAFPLCIKNDVIDRQKLGQEVLFDKDKLETLESILYPSIKDKMISFCTNHKNEEIVFCDIPLLFEKGWDKYFDYTIALIIDKDLQTKRYLERKGVSLEKLEAIRKNQFSNQQKSSLANFTIDTSENLNKTYFELENIITTIKTSHENFTNAI